MFKKVILFILMIPCIFIQADNSIGRVGNNVQSTFQNAKISVPAKKTLDINYAVFNYQMELDKFSKVLERYNLSKSAPLDSVKNIVFFSLLDNKELDSLQRKLTKEFSSRHTGSTKCGFNDGFCGGSGSAQISNTLGPKITNSTIIKSMSIQFKTYTNNKGTSVRVICNDIINDAINQTKLFSFQSEAWLKNVKNKNYIMVSQISKHGILHGQIILLSFDNNQNSLVSTFWSGAYIKR